MLKKMSVLKNLPLLVKVTFTNLSRGGAVVACRAHNPKVAGSSPAPATRFFRLLNYNAMIFGSHDDITLKQFHTICKNADRAALMADGHVGYVMPIGGVAAYKNHISPVGVGFDIACGNMAIRLNEKASDIDVDYVLDEIQRQVSFGVGQINSRAPKDHALFDSDLWNSFPDKHIRDQLKSLARKQLGTVGSGNHFVDIFEDESGYAWVGVHFGSRGLGHKIATGFLNLAVNKDWNKRAKEQEVLLDYREEIGEMYLNCMHLAGKYAYAGREWVCQVVQDIIGSKRTYQVHNHHNFAWREVHDGQQYFVVRKGATPAFKNQEGFIGGSMGDDSVIVEGVDCAKSKAALYSTVHGAGRVMSRSQAAGKYKWVKQPGAIKKRVCVKTGKITWDMLYDWLNKKGVKLRGAGCDEAPHAYRRLADVLDEHSDTVKIKHTLRPIGVVMAGENEFDPYKD